MKLYDTITEDSWCKNALDTGKRACLLGHALRLYPHPDGHPLHMGKTNDGRDVFDELMAALALCYPERLQLDLFNNHADTTLEDVLRVCKVADV